MDGVLVDLISTWLAAYNHATGSMLTPAHVTSYNWNELVHDSERFYELLDSECLFAVARPYRDISGLFDLFADSRFDVHIVSTVSEHAPDGHRQKADWLRHFCPWLPYDRLTTTAHKHMIRGDVLIEDSPENIDAWTEANSAGHAICIRAAYNANWHPKCSTRVTMADDITDAAKTIFRSYT
jgi:5'(3')-deoxyribonucleotidase